jgi:hypothetical protein
VVSLRNLVIGLTVFLILSIATVAMTAAPSGRAHHCKKALTGVESEGNAVVSRPPEELIRKAYPEVHVSTRARVDEPSTILWLAVNTTLKRDASAGRSTWAEPLRRKPLVRGQEEISF